MAFRRITNLKHSEEIYEGRLIDDAQPFPTSLATVPLSNNCRTIDIFTPPPPNYDVALWLNGGSAYIDLGASAAVPDTNNYTIEFWYFTFNTNVKFGRVFSQGSVALSTYQIAIIHYFDYISFCVGTGGTAYEEKSAWIWRDHWNHVAIVRENNTQYSMYLNGDTAMIENSPLSSVTASGEMFIGCREGERNFAPVALSDFRIWNVSRTQTQIKDNMYTRLTGSETGLTHFWKLNDKSSTITDSAGTMNGTAYNEYAWLPER